MDDPRRSEPWFPDLCRTQRVAIMLGLAELVVLVVVLTPDGAAGNPLARFVYISGFALWVAIAICALLCRLRARISQLPVRLGSLLALLLAGAVAGIFAGILHSLYGVIGPPLMGLGFSHFVLRCVAVTMLITALALRYFYINDRWVAQLEAHARAEADALQARIRPHFLFNSMNLIAGLLRRDPEVAEQAVLDLSDLFRAALGTGEGDSDLRAECELAERYLSIESLRLGARLQVEWHRDEPLPWSLPMPRLILQPLVENAVLHGVSRLPEGGKVVIGLSADELMLRIRIDNPAPDPEGVKPGLRPDGAGHAQRNIAHRLAYRYGETARLERGWHDGEYHCRLQIPLKGEGA
ncbi:MAG: sensor histidine kinase [Xanthomonadaceae bacterium]|jgi:two-component system sensor histidine kinase AlgZ|nr:sensor histidine kinase [Xanthomonadaceae bacterium]